jgi:Leucine-rich repeat (LRR) protein
LDAHDLDGFLPAAIGNLTNCIYLSLTLNLKLSGTIPSLDSLTQLEILDLGTNNHTGSIPSLDNLTQLQYLWVHNNSLEDSVPPSVASLRSLVSMQLQHNRLTGTLNADVFNNLTQLQALYLYNNALSGELPTSIATLANLVSVQLQHNKFRGGLDGVFDPTVQRSVAVVQLSSNQLQGTISSDIFALPSLSTFALASNCMQGPLPTSICESTSLQELLLDGLHTASSCQQPLLGGLIPGVYSLGRSAAGLADQLHECFFSMPQLNVLHLSGNGLTGSLPNMANYSNFTDLVLSHNSIRGLIPRFLQEQQV